MQEPLLSRRVNNHRYTLTGMELSKRIKSERLRRDLSQEELAKLVGITQPAVKKIEDGVTRRSRFLPRIAQVLGLNLQELVPEAAVPPALPRRSRRQAEHKGERVEIDFPIFASEERAGGEIEVKAKPVDFAVRPAPLQHVSNAYGLLIAGTTMEPEYRPGDLALINPNLAIIGGEVYVFYAQDEGRGRATIRHLRRSTPDSWLVRLWNPARGASQDLTLARKDWKWAHRILGKYSRW
jgi:transcriptional regulator with XRE-family HTH domain